MQRRFGSIVRGIVQATLASTVIACGGDVEGDVEEDGSGFACTLPLGDMFANLAPAVGYDYIELRMQTIQDDGLSAPIKLLSSGLACSGALDPEACKAALANAVLPSDPDSVGAGWIAGGNPRLAQRNRGGGTPIRDRVFIVVTFGDTVRTLLSTADVVSVLAPIDTLEKARLVLTTQSMDIDCVGSGPYSDGWKRADDGSWEFFIAYDGCADFNQRHVRVGTDGTLYFVADETARDGDTMCGRRPAGLVTPPPSSASPVASYLAGCAYLEAASVLAFRRLEEELVHHGAPKSLAHRARRSRRDEIRHARDVSLLARSFGGHVPPVEAEDVDQRDLLAIAVENAVEGCTVETYGALLASFQAARAKREHQPLLRRIAEDEIRHAELAHDVAAWLDGKLTAEERATVEAARRAAAAKLRAELGREPHPDLVAEFGVPSAAEALRMMDGMESLLGKAA